MKGSTLLLLVVGAVAAYQFTAGNSTQVHVAGDGELSYPGYQIRSLESFDLSGRVLSRKNYRMGREADLSPLDLAMGWGEMADPDVLADIEVSQRNRWYFWQAQQMPIARRAIETQSANIHIIAANETVARQLQNIAAHDEVRLRGDLVEVRADDGWRWRSSLSRTDTGRGACEVLLLHDLEWI
ncbi:MAG: hypothetical protein AAF993_08080 [Pseudomonadota bacterium]